MTTTVKYYIEIESEMNPGLWRILDSTNEADKEKDLAFWISKHDGRKFRISKETTIREVLP